jgi:hypothetical protein
MKAPTMLNSEAKALLVESTEWRMIELLFRCPSPEWKNELKSLAGEVQDADLYDAAMRAIADASEGAFHSIFGPGGPAPAREASYQATIQLGYLMSELNAFYDAFAYAPACGPSAAEPPDHVSVEAGFMSFLRLKQAFALSIGAKDEAAITAEAASRFLREHLSNIGEPLSYALEHSGETYLELVLFFSVAAMAQQAAQSATKPMPAAAITVHGSVRVRVEGWNWFQADSGDNTYTFNGNIFRLSASKSVDRWDWQAELAAPLLIGLPNDAIAPAPQGQLGLGGNYFAANGHRTAAMVFPKQLFFKWKNLGAGGQNVRIGRFEFSDGAEHTPTDMVLAALKRDHVNQRLIGPFTFTHVGRSFDGVEYSLNRKATNVTFAAALPTRGVFQVDGWGWNTVGVSYAAFTGEWGRGPHSAESRGFAIEYVDWRHVLKTDNRSVPVRSNDTGRIRIETLGGHSIHAITTSRGPVDLLAWSAVQVGRWGAQAHRAWSVDFEAGFQPKDLPRLKPWLRAGFTRGSGDGDAADGEHGTFFQILPTPRIYARFPFFNMMNIEDRYCSLIIRPQTKVTISNEVHSLRLANSNDLWYTGGGVFQPWTFGYTGRPAGEARSLANLYDVQAEYRVDTTTSIVGYFGFAQGRSVLQTIYPIGKNGKFSYVEMTHRF